MNVLCWLLLHDWTLVSHEVRPEHTTYTYKCRHCGRTRITRDLYFTKNKHW